MPHDGTRRHAARLAAATTLLLALAATTFAQAPEPASTYRFGGDGNENVRGVAVNADGAAYLVGMVQDQMARPVEGLFDAFVHAVAPDGTPAWTRQIGTPGIDILAAVAVAPDGDLVVVGSSDGTLEDANAGGIDAWAFRLAPDGETRWRTTVGSAGDDEANAVAVASDGTIYVAGSTSGDLAGAHAGGDDAFVIALGPDGDERWRVQDGSSGDDALFAASPAPDDGVYVGGHSDGDVGGPNAGGWDGVVRRYDASGATLWSHRVAGEADERIYGLATTPEGGAVVAGAGPEGPEDGADVPVFVRALDADGGERWSYAFGPARRDMGHPVAVAEDGTVFVAATTEGEVASANTGVADAVLVALDPDGSERWRLQVGSERFDDASGVATWEGAVLLAGDSQGALPGAASEEGYDGDGFLIRYPF